MIHPSAIIHPTARIGDGASVGAYSVIGPDVDIGPGTRVASHVVINGPTVIGSGNRILEFCSLGGDPQDKKFSGEAESRLEIGNDNVIREFCTISRGTGPGGGVTRVGDDNWIMAYVHVAHDCMVGNNTVFANNATVAGHVVVEDFAVLGGFTGVHQFCRLGKYSFTAISSVVVKDVPPCLMVSGNTARPRGLNREGLKRHAFPPQEIECLRRAYRILYRDGLVLKDALEKLAPLAAESASVREFLAFIRGSARGIVR